MRAATLASLAPALILACGDKDEAPATDTGADEGPGVVEDDDSPYLGEVDGDPGETFDAAAVEEAVEGLVAAARQLHAYPALLAYSDMMGLADEDCPTWYTSEEGLEYWYDSCTTEGGAAFEGYGYTVEYSEEEYPEGFADGDGNHWWGLQYYGIASIAAPDGSSFTSGGGAGLLYGYTDEGNSIFYSAVNEGFAYDGSYSEGTWLGAGLDPEMAMYAIHSPEVDGRIFVISGRATVESEGVHAVVLDEITIFDEALGSTCPEEPAGTVSILDSEGNWYDLVFDGPDFSGNGGEAERCDGCAEAWQGATLLGEACIDFSPLLDWDTHPFAGLE